MAEEAKLHIGCGRDVREGWTNLDHPANKAEGVVRCDIDQPDVKLPFDDDTFDMAEATHVLEHIHHLLPAVQEIWRVLKPKGRFYAAVPYGSSDDAHEDPTHVRQFFPGSWAYFSQKTYWRADYGYKGDFMPLGCLLYIDAMKYPAGQQQTAQVLEDVITRRNTVHEMKAVLEAQKPARHWTDGEMDTWETRVVFTEYSGGPVEKRAEAAKAAKDALDLPPQDLWTP